jgi:hypothetical protein
VNRVRRDPSQIAVALAGAVAVVVFIGGIAAIVNDEEEVPVAGARIQLDGTAVRLDPGGDRVPLSDGDILHPGDRVDVTAGMATFELAGGGSIEGRAGRADDHDDTSVTVGDPMELLAGDALAVGPAGVAVEAAGTVVTLDAADGEGAARIRRDLAVTAATYEGTTAVDSVGQHRDVPALRQLSVSSIGRPAAEPDPLAYDPADPWDLRYLAAAIDASRQLDTLSRSFTAQNVALTNAADYERLLPRLRSEPAFDVSFLGSDRSAGETLIGAVIAVLGGQGGFAERWSEVFAFRDQGAAWGLVVRDQDVTEDAVIDDVTRALGVLLEPLVVPEVAGPDPGEVVDPSDDSPSTGGSTPTTAAPTTTATTTPPDDEPEAPPATLLPPLPPIDIPGLPPITIPTLPPLDSAPLPDGGGLLGDLLEPLADVLDALIGPSGLLDAS